MTEELLEFGDFGGPQVKKRPWMDEKKFILGTPENLEGIIDSCIASGRYGIDLETSGLDSRVFDSGGSPKTVDQIAGVCLSPDGVSGFYIPLRHVRIKMDGIRSPLGCNIPMTVFDQAFRRLIKATEEGKTVAVFHNGKFDQEFLQFNGEEAWGEWDKPTIWDDTMILAYLRDTRIRTKGLKPLSKEYLNIEMVELDELFPDAPKGAKKDFTTLDPSNQAILWYACGDAICTRLLYDVLSPDVLSPSDGLEQKGIYKIEKWCVAATRWMERNRIHINRTKIAELIRVGHKEWFGSVMAVYAEAEKLLGRDVMPGSYKVIQERFVIDDPSDIIHAQLGRAEKAAESLYPDPVGKVKSNGKEYPLVYDINSPKQLGPMFEELGVEGLKPTLKSGQISTNKTDLERIIEESGDQFPFMKKIRRFREVSKALSTFLYPMWLDSDPRDDTMRINFRGHKVDTGRFSTPAKESVDLDAAKRDRMEGWPQVNIQAIPKSGGKDRPECMTRIRECISARAKDVFVVALDYAGVELRIITNLSLEPKWIHEFFHCSGCGRTFDRGDGKTTPEAPPPRCPNCGSDRIGDLHTLTGLAIYGQDAAKRDDWKELRGHSKSLNFAMSYGGGGSAAQRAVGVDKNEGGRIKRQFDGEYSGLKTWWGRQHAFARQHGWVKTAFGRKYPVPDIYSQDGFFRSKAERNSVNGPVQGTSADITKLAMALIYKECKARGWLDRVRMIITMHDELVFEIEGALLEEAIKVIVPIMTRNQIILNQNWPIPLTSDMEIGHDWSVPWDLNGMTYKEVKFLGNKKFKDAEKLPAGTSWDSLSSWPEELKPWFSVAKEEIPGPSSGPQIPPAIPPSGPMAPSAPAPSSSFAPFPDSGKEILPDIPEGEKRKETGPELEGPPDIAPGEVYEFRLNRHLSLDTVFRLADVLNRSRNGGTRVLKLKTKDGKPLDEWEQLYGKGPFFVNHLQFYFLAHEHGLT